MSIDDPFSFILIIADNLKGFFFQHQSNLQLGGSRHGLPLDFNRKDRKHVNENPHIAHFEDLQYFSIINFIGWS